MKIRFRKYTANFVLVVLALQILNMSITCRITDDCFFFRLDNSINIADHAVEFITEDILGFVNAFPEVKENKQQHSVSFQKVQEFKLFSFEPTLEIYRCSVLLTKNYFLFKTHPYFGYLREICPPPPKAA